MAGDGGDRYRRMDGWLAKEIQAELGVLAFSLKQCAVDHLGRTRSCVRIDLAATLSCVSKHQRGDEESQRADLTGLS